jgi:hypothetical protein
MNGALEEWVPFHVRATRRTVRKRVRVPVVRRRIVEGSGTEGVVSGVMVTSK